MPNQNLLIPKTIMSICLIAIITTLALCLSGCSSSSKQSSSSSSPSNSTNAKSSEYYEGDWFCSGYTKDGKTTSYASLTAEQKRNFSHIYIQLKSNNKAYMGSISNDGQCTNRESYKWKPTSSGINLDDNMKFELQENGALIYTSRGESVYFEKCISGNELSVGDLNFKNITFDAPIDLVYTQEAISQTSKHYGIVDSCRTNGPSLMMTATETDADDITELSSYYKGVEDHFIRYNGSNYFVYADEEHKMTDVAFVADNTWYKIKFDYSNDTTIDYSEYASTFFTTIKVS